VMDHVWYKSNSHASTVSGVPLEMQFRSKEEIVELFKKNGFEPVHIGTHDNDKDNIFYPKFFAFKCAKPTVEVDQALRHFHPKTS
jgi:hypothetical protein